MKHSVGIQFVLAAVALLSAANAEIEIEFEFSDSEFEPIIIESPFDREIVPDFREFDLISRIFRFEELENELFRRMFPFQRIANRPIRPIVPAVQIENPFDRDIVVAVQVENPSDRDVVVGVQIENPSDRHIAVAVQIENPPVQAIQIESPPILAVQVESRSFRQIFPLEEVTIALSTHEYKETFAFFSRCFYSFRRFSEMIFQCQYMRYCHEWQLCQMQTWAYFLM